MRQSLRLREYHHCGRNWILGIQSDQITSDADRRIQAGDVDGNREDGEDMGGENGEEVPQELAEAVEEALASPADALRNESNAETFDAVSAEMGKLDELEADALAQIPASRRGLAVELFSELSDMRVARTCIEAAADGINGLWAADREAQRMEADPDEELDRRDAALARRETIVSGTTKSASNRDEKIRAVRAEAKTVRSWIERYQRLLSDS